MTGDHPTVVVTGAARGIGRATAERFGEAGATVVVADVDGETADSTAASLPGPDDHRGVEVDVRDREAVEALGTLLEEEFGGADVLVNNAGIGQTLDPTVDQSVEEWERVVDIHLKGTYLCSKFLAPPMLERGRGSVVNVSSVTAFAGFPYRTGYGPAKAGIANLTKVLAIEWAERGVRVNAVAPGYVLTDLVQEHIDQGLLDPEEIRGRTPTGEFVATEEIAEAIHYLASDAPDAITGTVLPVDGGWAAYGYV